MRNESRILFIGAGPFQAPAIERARAMGLTVIATDRDPEAPGLKQAHHGECVDVRDVDGTLTVARRYGVNGVLAVASEVGVPTAARVAETLGLPGIGVAVAERATHKGLQREAFQKAGVPSPSFVRVRSEAQALAALRSLGLPCILKPSDNSGSRGVFKVVDESELYRFFPMTLAKTRNQECLVEEFMEGVECTVEALSFQGRHVVLGIPGKSKPETSYRVATELVYPPSFESSMLAQIEDVACRALDALGIRDGPSHTEVIVGPTGPRIVEVAARGGGFHIFARILELLSGVDAVAETIKIALGQTPSLIPTRRWSAVLRFFAPPPGVLAAVSGVEEASRIPNTEFGLFKKVGDTVPELASDGDRTGYLISWGPTREAALEAADRLERTISFEVTCPV